MKDKELEIFIKDLTKEDVKKIKDIKENGITGVDIKDQNIYSIIYDFKSDKWVKTDYENKESTT